MKQHLLPLAMLLSTPLLTSAQDTTPAEAMIAQWVQTEKLITTEKLDWEKSSAQSQQLIDLYQKELSLLDKELNDTGKNVINVDDEAEALKQSIHTSEQARLSAIGYLNQIKPRVFSLYKKLPDHLQKELEEPYLALGNEVTNSNLSDSLQAVIKIQQETARFNRSYTFGEQTIELSGQKLHAKTLYLGLSCGFFQAGETYGKITPTENGWVFTEQPSIKKELKKAFALEQKTIPSCFFELPLQLNELNQPVQPNQ